ncbi:MAG TPA: NAD(P)H-dependent glycerol-3-phosphate dehydrogenase [Bacillota bacterium]|nr:NAD(P)H-dependent glycerol-3-phosphate dehydrogenase [Bacillota bacterium]
MNKICILGAGSFGTAIEDLLKGKGFETSLWSRHMDLAACLRGAECVIFAVPAQDFREVLTKAAPFIEADAMAVNLAKGLEINSRKRLSEVAAEIAPNLRYVALSGPSHAEEIMQRLPTTVCVSSPDEELARRAQELFMTDYFRVYTNGDMIGTELGGALKNIIALGSGICDGLKFGDNARAALMTRGIAEISRLGTALGARQETFFGLSGIGDLIVTCCSMYSRNRRCGILIGEGKTLKEAVDEIGQVVESVTTVKAAHRLAAETGTEMPITSAIHSLLYEEADVRETAAKLMTRSAKPEYIE